MRARWAAIGAAVAVSLGGGVVMVANAGWVGPSVETAFKAIKPCRLLDTRTTATSQIVPQGIRAGKFGNQTTSPNDITIIFDQAARNTDINGDDFTYEYSSGQYRPIMGTCNDSFDDFGAGPGINPDDLITALVLNVATTDFTDSSQSFLTVYPWQLVGVSSPRPLIANLNPLSGVAVSSNEVTVGLSALDGNGSDPGLGTVKLSGVFCDDAGTHGDSNCSGLYGFRIYNNAGRTHVIVDVTGYYYIEGGAL